MAVSITMSVEGVAKAQRKLENLSVAVRRRITRRALVAAAAPVKAEAKARVAKRTGKLSKAIRSEADVRSGTNPVVRIGWAKRAYHGRFIEQGTRPHQIKARKGKVLVIGGRVVRGPVRHPGARARPFLQPALVARKGEAVATFGRVFKSEIEAVAGG